nr:hypothetical protein [Thermus sp. 2.9]
MATLSAARIGAFDLAVGNVLGSHLFNALILAWHDLLYPQVLFPGGPREPPASASRRLGHVGRGLGGDELPGRAQAGRDALALYLLGLLWLYALR